MGCAPSVPKQNPADGGKAQSRLDNNDVWDSDFKRPTPSQFLGSAPVPPSSGRGGSIMDRQADVRLSAVYQQEAAKAGQKAIDEIRGSAAIGVPTPLISNKKLFSTSSIPSNFNPHPMKQQYPPQQQQPFSPGTSMKKQQPTPQQSIPLAQNAGRLNTHAGSNNGGLNASATSHRSHHLPDTKQPMRPVLPNHGPKVEPAPSSHHHHHPKPALPLPTTTNQHNTHHGTGGRPPTGISRPPTPHHRHPSAIMGPSKHNFEDCYIRGRDLGKGAFAKVFIGTEKSSRREFAIKKIYDRSKMKWNGRDALMDEIGNLQKLRQAPNIVYLHEYFLEEKQCYLVMELLPGKELFERIIQKSTFTEAEARNSCRCVLSALDFMHERRMTHRDLKPENLLLVDELDIDKVKLSDFGFSKCLQSKNECRTLCGTPGYLAPEILERWPSYDVKCDVWSFGVILFLLLGGYLPFDAHGSNDTKKVFERTRNGQYYFYPQRWEGISQAAKDLIAKCLTVSPNKRTSAKGALCHAWMGEGLALPSTIISAQSLRSTYLQVKQRDEAHRQREEAKEVDRLQELNDDFTVYLEGRQGDSIVSAMTGAGRAVGGATPASYSPPFQEDSPSGNPFSFFYNKEEQLGQGGFATVFRCRHKRTGLTYAVKQVDTTNVTKDVAATLKEEIMALKYLRGAPSIIRLYDVFEEGNITYLILEEMKGGNLLQRILDKEVYTEREARDLCKVLFSAVNYCHTKQIAHRDIKLENLLLKEENDDASIKLADFGFAKKVKRENGLKTFLGTARYMAPEILDLRSKGYDHRCDLWSVGVVAYTLLAGYYPFEGNPMDIKALVMGGEYHFHDEYWNTISPSAKKLIASFLQVDPSRRLTCQQAMSSRWMTLDDAELSVVDLSMTKSRMENMVTGKEKLKNVVLAIMGANKIQAVTDLKESLEGGHGIGAEDATYAIDYIAESDSELDIEVCFEDVYELGRPIGSGSLAKIHSAKNLLSNKDYSVKKIIRRALHPTDFAALNDEIAVLQELADGGKTHVVNLYEVYEDPDATYIVMDRIHGEILIDKLIQKKKYTEFDAKELVRNLLMGVHHCHSKSIAIRNLTLDNLLLPYASETDIVIVDFEIAKKVLYRNSLKTQCGTQEFVAPEVLENRPAYDVSCDMWTVGVIVFILLGGYYPFRGKTDAEILKNVRYGNFEFRERLWKGVSNDAKDLLRSMMTVNPDERVTAQAALSHPWIKADNFALSADLLDNVAEIRKEAMAHKFKGAVKTVVATQKLQSQM